MLCISRIAKPIIGVRVGNRPLHMLFVKHVVEKKVKKANTYMHKIAIFVQPRFRKNKKPLVQNEF